MGWIVGHLWVKEGYIGLQHLLLHVFCTEHVIWRVDYPFDVCLGNDDECGLQARVYICLVEFGELDLLGMIGR